MSKPKSRCMLTLSAMAIVLFALLACGDQTIPEGDTSPGDTPAKSTPALTPAAQVQNTSLMSLDDYLAICAGPTPGQTDAELTLAGFATVMGEFTEQLEAVEPPEEVTDWHDAVLVYQRAVKEALDDAPGPGEGESEDLYILGVLFPVGLQHQPAISEAIEGMDRDLVARMLEAGCIDEDILSMSLTEEEMKELGVGNGGTAGGRVITEFASISAGDNHTCGVGTDGYVGCWGNDIFGKASPPDGEFSFVAAGWSHTCGVRADGSVACWGGGDDAEETMPPGGEFISVSAGNTHNCGVRTDGSVACWGDDDDGEASPPAGQFVSVSAGDDSTCGIRADGSVACWGDLRDKGRRLRRLLGRRIRWPTFGSVGKTSGRGLHLRQPREYPLMRSEDGRFRRVLGLGSPRSILAARGRLCLRQRRRLPHLRDKGRRLRRLLGL